MFKLGYSLQLDLDACILSFSWKVTVCGVDTTSENPFWDNVRITGYCELFDKALDVYLDEYVSVLSTAQLPVSASIGMHTRLLLTRE